MYAVRVAHRSQYTHTTHKSEEPWKPPDATPTGPVPQAQPSSASRELLAPPHGPREPRASAERAARGRERKC